MAHGYRSALVVAFVLASATAHADRWNASDTAMQVTFTGITLLDWHQANGSHCPPPRAKEVAMSDNENTEDENIEVTNEVRDIAAKYAWLDDDLSALLCDFIVKKGLHRELLQYLDEMGQTLSG